MEKRLQGNIWKYALLLIANKRIFVAILGAYYLTIPGVTPWWIGTLLLAGNIAAFALEIPSGYLSDKIGHKRTLVISRVMMIISTLFFLGARGIPFLALGSVFLSASQAFHSGTGSAFMHETLQALKREDEYAKVTGKVSSVGFAVPTVFMILVPFLVGISYKLPFAIALVTDVVGLVAALLLTTPPVPSQEVEEIDLANFKQVVREGAGLKFFRFGLFAGIVSGLITGVGGFRAPYQSLLGIPVIWFGVLFGIGRGLASLMLAYSGKIKALAGDVLVFYKYLILLYAALIFALAFVSNRWAIAGIFILVNAFQWGLSQVDTSYLVRIIDRSRFKASLLSIHAQFDEAASALSAFGLGFIIERWSYQAGFMVLGAAMLVVLIPLYLFIARSYTPAPPAGKIID